ncbi:hypothetical protein D3C72_1640620 [compost metagenome]
MQGILPEPGIRLQQQVGQLLVPGLALEGALLLQALLLAHQMLQAGGILGKHRIRVGAVVLDQGRQIAAEMPVRGALEGRQTEVGLLQAGIQPLVVEIDQPRYLHTRQQTERKQHHAKVTAHRHHPEERESSY